VPLFRILLVEDFEPFRRFVRSALQSRPEFEVVGEALDGLEAVQKAKDLQPDLILLDIGLPKLNGMAAAEQIGIVAPSSKLLFISLESSGAIVEEAFRLGAQGYVHKLRAQNDLIPAIEAILAGKQFVSGNLEFSLRSKSDRRHEVQFYSDDMFFVESGSRFIAGALKANNAAIVIVTAQHAESLVQKLKADGFDIDGAIQQGTYISLNATECLKEMIVNGRPDECRAFRMVGSVIESSIEAMKRQNSRVAIFGECAGLLYAEGNCDAAIELEKKGNDLIETHDVDILCSYPQSAFQRTDDTRIFKDICAEHTAVFSP
jgi:DNA-binding NarL/FixJ family response regulator